MFDNKFGKCGPTFKTLSPVDSQENSLCIHHKEHRVEGHTVQCDYIV